jgi:hypothetical protein
MACDPYYSYVKALFHADGLAASTVLYDATGLHAWYPSGDVAISNTESWFDGGAAWFHDGHWFSTGTLSAQGYDWNIGTGDFCLEGRIWIAAASVDADSGSGDRHMALFGDLSALGGWQFFVVGDGTDSKRGLGFVAKDGSGAESYVTWEPAAPGANYFEYGGWYVVAVSRCNGWLRFFVDGALVHQEYFPNDLQGEVVAVYQWASCVFGASLESGKARNFHGYIDEFRYTNGKARYVDSYVTSTNSNGLEKTTVLLHFDRNNNNSIFIQAYGPYWTRDANARHSTGWKLFGTACAYFPTGTDASCIWTPDSPDMRLDDADWTIEFAARPLALPALGTYDFMLAKYSTASARSYGIALINDAGVQKLAVLLSHDGLSADTIGLYPHGKASAEVLRIAVTREGDTVRTYLDGTLVGTLAFSGSLYGAANELVIGHRERGVTVDGYKGFIDEVRITKGVALYTGSSYTLATAKFELEYGPFGDACAVAPRTVYAGVLDQPLSMTDLADGALAVALTTPVSAEQGFSWLIRDGVYAEADLSWLIRAGVYAEAALAWSIRQGVPASQQVNWSISLAVQAKRCLSWGVLMPVNHVYRNALLTKSGGDGTAISEVTTKATLRGGRSACAE